MDTKRDATELLKYLVESMTRKIFDGTYPHGKKLRQETLAEEYDVSRTPVREALRQLEIKGLVVQKWRHGVTVLRPSRADISANYWLRAELEGMAGELAAQLMSDEDLRRLQIVHADCVEAVLALHALLVPGRAGLSPDFQAHLQRWVDKNAQFHSMIYQASGNTSLQRIIKDLHVDYTQNILSMTAAGMVESRARKSIAHHHAIVDALTARNPQAVRDAMRRHIQESGEFIVEWLQNQAPVRQPLRRR